MNKFIPAGPFTYRRSTDGCDETFDVVSESTGEFVTAFHFWEAEEECESRARWVAAALNVAHAMTGLSAAYRSTGGIEGVPVPPPLNTEVKVELRRQRADRFAPLVKERSRFETLLRFIDVLTDAKHWCDQNGVDFDDAILNARRDFRLDFENWPG